MTNRVLLFNSISGTALYIINVIAMFIMSPVIVKTLGNSNYGIWEIMISVVGYMGVLDLGVGQALVRYVSVAHSRNDLGDLKRVISTVFVFFLGMSILAIAVLAAFRMNPGILFGSGTENSRQIKTFLSISTFNVGMTFTYIQFTAILLGTQRHYILNVTRIANVVVSSVAAYYLLTSYSSDGLIIMAAIDPVSKLAQMIVYYSIMHRDRNIPTISISACSLKSMKELFVYGSKSVVLMLASRLQNQSAPFIIGHLMGIGQIVYFAIPNRLVEYGKGFAGAVGFPLMPYFGSIVGLDDSEALRAKWLKTSLGLHLATIGLPIIVWFFGVPFITLWLGREYAEAGRYALKILAAGMVFDLLSSNAGKILMATAQHGKSAMAWLAVSLASIPLSILGVRLWGIAGVAASVAVAGVTGTLITLVMACNVVGISLFAYCRDTIAPLFVPVVCMSLSMWLLGRYISPSSYGALVTLTLVGGIAYCLAVWFLVLNREMRRDIFHAVGFRINSQRN